MTRNGGVVLMLRVLDGRGGKESYCAADGADAWAKGHLLVNCERVTLPLTLTSVRCNNGSYDYDEHVLYFSLIFIAVLVCVSSVCDGDLVSRWRYNRLRSHPLYPIVGCRCQVRTGTFARKALAHTLFLSVGLLYLWSADSVRKGTANGLEGALGVSSMSNYF